MAAEVVYGFYLDSYGGWALAEEFAGALPAALRCVRGLVGGVMWMCSIPMNWMPGAAPSARPWT